MFKNRFILLLISILYVVTSVLSQDSLNYAVKPLKPINSESEVMLTFANSSKSFVTIPLSSDYISNYDLEKSSSYMGKYYSYSSYKLEDFKEEKLPFKLEKGEVLGSVTYNEQDSNFIYCAKTNGSYSIYEWKNNSKSLLLKGTVKQQFLHPFITEDGTQIFFCSNSKSGNKDYNIFYLNKINNGWSEPVKLGPSINTDKNELFPTWYNDTLYFSSQKDGNLDIYYSAKSTQYSSIKKLAEPFNSKSDDFLLFKINAQVNFINSNRRFGKDEALLIQQKIPEAAEKTTLSGFIACSGNRISNVPLKLNNSLGIPIDKDVSDQNGNFIFRGIKSIKNYRIKLENKDVRTEDCAVIYLTDKDGNIIQKIVLNDEGEFVFELLETDDIEALNLLPVKDESLLQIEIDGQIYESIPGDVGKGEAVKILDENGNLIALAYTTEQGNFEFNDLSPEKEYTFSFDEFNQQIQLLVKKNGEMVKIPVENNKAVYERVDKDNALELINEVGDKITIEKDEFFRLQNIFYDYNSSELSTIAKFQLDRLAMFIFNNDEILIELTSHTDSRGKAEYNLTLSEKRVNQAINYLISKGVQPERMTGIGMGEKKPINNCIDGKECSESEHALNRRTEIRIIAL